MDSRVPGDRVSVHTLWVCRDIGSGRQGHRQDVPKGKMSTVGTCASLPPSCGHTQPDVFSCSVSLVCPHISGFTLTYIKKKSTVCQNTSLVAQTVENLPTMQETWVLFLGREDPLEKGMATHSSILVCRVPWTVAYQAPLSMGL